MIRHPISIIAAVLLVAVGTVVLSAAPAAAQENGCSSLTTGAFTGTNCTLAEVITPAAPPSPGGSTLSVNAPPGPVFVSAATAISCDAASAGGWVPVPDVPAALAAADPQAGASPAEPGVIWVRTLVGTSSGSTSSGFFACAAVGAGEPTPPPPLPTADEIWGAALSTVPAVNLDPYVRGLTGLETLMWYEGATADSVALTLNGYGVAAEIETIGFGWDMGGPAPGGLQRYSLPVPGSAAEPAATHTYAEPGPVLVVHEVVWAGTSVFTGPGLPAGGVVVDLGEAVLATSRDYDVIEVRAPLVGGDEPGTEP